jgi:hypothetical protein
MESLVPPFDIKAYRIDNAECAGKRGPDGGVDVCIRSHELEMKRLVAENHRATLGVP